MRSFSHNVVHGFLSSIVCYMDDAWKVKIGGWHKRQLMYSECGQQVVQGMLAYAQNEDDCVDWGVREERKQRNTLFSFSKSSL